MKSASADCPRLLIVEDEDNVRDMFRRSFLHAGYQVEVAADGREALDLLERVSVGLVLLDICMPGINGMDVLRALAGDPGAPPVLVLSGCITTEEGTEAIRLGAVDVLFKNQRVAQIIAKVAELLPPDHHTVFSVIRVHLREALSRAQVASWLEVSEKTVTNRIRRHCNQSFGEYVRACRLQEAKRLLEATGLTVKEVADRVGFGSVRVMDRAFLAVEGCSPTQYRQKIKFGWVPRNAGDQSESGELLR